MKLYFSILTLSVFLLNSCYTIVDKKIFNTGNPRVKNDLNNDARNNPESQEIVGVGTVTFFESSGGTREIRFHSGFILKNPDWWIPPKDQDNIFLEPDSIIQKFCDKYVYVEGILLHIPRERVNSLTFTSDYNVILVDKVYCIEESYNEKKPDLIISFVSSSLKYNEPKHIPGEPVSGGDGIGRSFIEYTVTIRNIGKAAVMDPFYVFSVNTEFRTDPNHYSGGTLVNDERRIINPGESIEIKINIGLPTSQNRSRKFLVNTDGRPADTDHHPFIRESNYDNNTYLY